MRASRRIAILLVGLVAMVATFWALVPDTGLSPPTIWVIGVSGTCVFALAMGYLQEHSERTPGDGLDPVFDSPRRNLAFWAVYWAAFFHSMHAISALFNEASRQGSWRLGYVILSVGGLISLTGFVVIRRGIDPAVNPRTWVKEYRRGRSDAKNE